MAHQRRRGQRRAGFPPLRWRGRGQGRCPISKPNPAGRPPTPGPSRGTNRAAARVRAGGYRCGGELPESQATHDQRYRLCTGDTTLSGDHRQENCQHGHGCDGGFEQINDGSGGENSTEIDQQPRETMLDGQAQRTEYPLTRGPTRCAAYPPWPLLPRSASPPRPESRPAPGSFHRRRE